jgi:hypothetical protein
MSALGTATIVDGKADRKLNNALTQTFEAGPHMPVATATQKGSAGVLFGFKNGGSGTFTLSGDGTDNIGDGTDIVIATKGRLATITNGDGSEVGRIETTDDHAALATADGTELARLVGHPAADKANPAWTYPLIDGAGAPLGEIILVRSSGRIDVMKELWDAAVWWDRAGKALKLPTLGTRLTLNRPVDGPLGDLLLAACVNLCLGPGAFVAP